MTIILAISILLGGLFLYSRFKNKEAEVKYPPKGEFITVEGIRLHYLSRGKGKKTVVFLHGAMLSANDYEPLLDRAAQQGYHALAFDRPGYGYSERPLHEAVTPQVQARLIHKALVKLGIEKTIVVGHSWSGLLALTYALSYPEQVTGIVILGGAMYKEGYPAEKGDPIAALIQTPVIGFFLLHFLLRSPLGTKLTDLMLEATFAPDPVPSDYRALTHALWLRPSQFKANREDVLAFPPAAAHISVRYPEIKQPIAVVVGEQDPFGATAQAQRLQETLPQAKLVMIPQGGHMIPHHYPEQVLDAIHWVSQSYTDLISR